MNKMFFLSSLILSLTQVAVWAQDKFTYEFARVDQPNDVPRYEVAFFNTATEFEDESQLFVQVKVVNDALQFIKAEGDKFRADFEVTVAILDTAGVEVQKRSWAEHILADNFDEVDARDLFVLTQNSFFVEPGFYKFNVELKDQETRRIGVKRGSMNVRDFSSDYLMISDVVVMDSVNFAKVFRDDFLSENSRNGEGGSPLYAFFEVYNVPRGDTLHIEYEITDQQRESLKESEYLEISAGRITQTFFEVNPELVYGSGNQLAVEAFYGPDTLLIGPQEIDPFKQVAYPIFKELADSIEKLKYIAKKDEMKRMKEAEGKAQLEEFRKFWSRRDPTPSTPENEYLEEYYRRVAIANRNFKGLKDGWETDMGHVFIMMGSPDYIERGDYNRYYGQTSIVRYPLILWRYVNIRRSVLFRHRAGEYRIENYHDIAGELHGEIRM